MSRLSPIVFLLLAAGPLGFQDSPATLRVLTYNIHHAEGMDRRIDLARVAGVIERVQPDLVALQEVDVATMRAGRVNQLAEIARLTGMHAEFGKAMDFEGGGYGVGILSRWPLVGADTHALPGTPDREPRTSLTVRVKAGEHGPLLQFTSTHFDQGRETDSRLAQATALNELLSHDGGLSILAGDMNARRDTDVMQALEAEWTNTSIADPDSSIPTARPRSRGDHVLVRPAESWRVVEWRVIDETVTSDHRPILVVLEWVGGH